MKVISLDLKIFLLFSAHTHPLLLVFCSILYYKDLDVDQILRRNRKEKLPKRIDVADDMEMQKMKLVYNKRIVNRWFLALKMTKNPQLIVQRYHNMMRIKTEEKKSAFKNLQDKVKKLFRKKDKENSTA